MGMMTARPAAESLDAKALLITPERVRFTYPLAGPFRRSLAYLVDVLVLACLVAVGALVSFLASFGTVSGIGADPGDLFRSGVGVWGVLRGDV